MKASIRIVVLLAGVLFPSACTADDLEGRDSTAPAGPPRMVEHVQIDGVWVFYRTPDPDGVFLQALHGGDAEIRDDCLYVDDTIVVWHVDQLDEAAQVIADVRAGEQSEPLIVGGGMSLDEGASIEDFPAVINERCPTSAVWHASGESYEATPSS